MSKYKGSHIFLKLGGLSKTWFQALHIRLINFIFSVSHYYLRGEVT